MKKIFIIIFTISLISCSDKALGPFQTSPNEINGKFINWNPANKDSIFWRALIDSAEHILTYAKVSNYGYFKIILPEPPNTIMHNYVKSVREDSIYVEYKDSILFSDTTAKFVSLRLEHYQRISFPTQCGNTNSFTITSTIGDYQIYYYYFDRPTEVNGKWYALLKNQFNPEYERTIITNYNKVIFKQGWNEIIVKLISLDNDKRIFEVLNENKSPTEWILIALPNEYVRLL